MKIRAQQCLTFPSCPVSGKGGAHAQQVSTHCRRARALITALSPRSYPNSHPHSSLGNNAPGEIYVASLRLGYLLLSSKPTFLWFMEPLFKRIASWPVSIWLVTSKHQLWRWMYSFFRASKAKGKRAYILGVYSGHAPSIRCHWILFYQFPIRIQTWLMILGVTFEHAQKNDCEKRSWNYVQFQQVQKKVWAFLIWIAKLFK